MTLHLLAATAAEHGGFNLAPYIAAAIAAGLFTISAVVLRSYRDVSHRTPDRDAPADHH